MSGYDDKPGREGLPYGGPFGDTSKDVWGGGFGDTPGGGVGVSELLGFVGESGGIASLPTTLTINSQSVAAAFFYLGQDGAATQWPGVAGGTATEYSSTARNLDGDSPTSGTADRIYCKGSSVLLENADNPSIGTDDIVFEMVARVTTAGANTCVLNVIAGATSTFLVRPIGSVLDYLRLDLNDGTNSQFINSATGLPIGAWFHAMCFIDRSGFAQWYLNGVASGSVRVVSAITGSLTPDSGYQIGHQAGGSNYSDGIGLLGFWHSPAWLDTHLQAAVAYERYARAFGVWATGATLQNDVRSTAGYLDKVSHVDGIRRLHYQGPGSHRYGRGYDDAFRVSDGVLSEAAATNLCLQSEDLSTTWTLSGVTVTTDSTTAPNGESTADSIDENGAAGNHFIRSDLQAYTNGVENVVSCYVKAIARSWFYIGVNPPAGPANTWAYFDVATGAIGDTGGGEDSTGSEYLGDGWYRIWLSFTAAGASGNTPFILADANGSISFTGGSTPSVYMWGAQVEAGTVPSSYTPTTTTTVTRTADALRYDVSALSLAEGTIAVDQLQPSDTPDGYRHLANINDGSAVNRIVLINDSTSGGDTAGLYVDAAGASQAAIADTTKNLDTGRWLEARATWKEDDFATFVDGVADGTPDASGTVPSGLTSLNVGYRWDGGLHINGLVKPRIYSAPTTNNVTDFGVVMANGEIYISSSAPTSLTTTPVIVAGTTTLGEAVDFDMPSNMRLRYLGTATKSFRFGCTITWSGAPNETVNATLYKNGSAVSKTTQRREIGPGGDVGNMSVKGAIELAQNDYVELYAAIEAGSDPGTATQMVLVCTEAS